MSLRAEGMIETKSWEENAYREANSGPKFTRASVDVSFRGDIEGEGAEEYLMVYTGDDSANFVGLERVDGSVGDRSGGFVIQHNGTFLDGRLKSEWFLVPGSGTEELRGLRGEGIYINDGGEPQTAYTPDYDFE